jgi:hypothetical protein
MIHTDIKLSIIANQATNKTVRPRRPTHVPTLKRIFFCTQVRDGTAIDVEFVVQWVGDNPKQRVGRLRVGA